MFVILRKISGIGIQIINIAVINLKASFLIKNRKSLLKICEMLIVAIIKAKRFMTKGASFNPNWMANNVTNLGTVCKYPA